MWEIGDKVTEFRYCVVSIKGLLFPFKKKKGFVPEEDYVGPDAEHHGDEAVAHQAEVSPPPPLRLLCRHLLCLRVTKLLPVTKVLLGIRADGGVEKNKG